MKSKQPPTITRSSAAEYLTFVAASGNQETSVEMRYEDENIWLTQKMMAEIYGVEVHTINYHLKNIFADNELREDSVIRDYRITAADSKNYNTKHYNLHAETEFEKYRVIQDQLYRSDFDLFIQEQAAGYNAQVTTNKKENGDASA